MINRSTIENKERSRKLRTALSIQGKKEGASEEVD
jgi:hypothetical protein